MIVNILGVPQLSLLEARLLCDIVGVRIGVLKSKAPNFVSYKPRYQVYFGPLRIIYIHEVEVFNQYIASLYEKPQHHAILLNLSKSTLTELGVPIHGYGQEPLTTQDFIDLLSSPAIRTPLEEQRLTKKQDLAQQVMQSINKESMLGKLQTSFYRIKQVDERQKIQSLVYAFLSGAIKKLPDLSNQPYLENQLSSDLCKRFRGAIKEAKTIGVDFAAAKHGIDRFEIAYCLKRGGHDVSK